MKIGFTGTQSVGKTTLVKALAELPEFKDYYIATERSGYLSSLGIPLNDDSSLAGQTIFLAERVSELMRENLLTDRTIIDINAFTLQSKQMNQGDKIDLINLSTNFISSYDYIFYISPEGVELEDNNIRNTNSDFRNLIDSRIKLLCDEYGYMTSIHYIKGTTEQRIQQILDVVKL